MKTRDEIINEWVSDSSVDPEKANDELLRIPALHAKYTRYLSDYRMELKKLNLKIDRVKREKHEYYSGKTPQEKLKADGKKPFKAILNAGVMNMYIDSDDEMQELSMPSVHITTRLSNSARTLSRRLGTGLGSSANS